MRDKQRNITNNEENWNYQKDLLTAKYSMLTEADFNFALANRDDLLRHIELRLGKTRRELIAILSSL
jgi:hypothetical protein